MLDSYSYVADYKAAKAMAAAGQEVPEDKQWLLGEDLVWMQCMDKFAPAEDEALDAAYSLALCFELDEAEEQAVAAQEAAVGLKWNDIPLLEQLAEYGQIDSLLIGAALQAYIAGLDKRPLNARQQKYVNAQYKPEAEVAA